VGGIGGYGGWMDGWMGGGRGGGEDELQRRMTRS
jgi:hypothetical protein